MTTQQERYQRNAAAYDQAVASGDQAGANRIARTEYAARQASRQAAADSLLSGLQQAGAPTPAAPASEVTGVRSLVSHLDQIADAHAGHGQGEGFLGSLNQMEVGQADQQLVRDAQEASANAAALWRDAAESVRSNNMPVSEAYSMSPDAANKHANTNE